MDEMEAAFVANIDLGTEFAGGVGDVLFADGFACVVFVEGTHCRLRGERALDLDHCSYAMGDGKKYRSVCGFAGRRAVWAEAVLEMAAIHLVGEFLAGGRGVCDGA
jgi:hypothetical protein